jgi:TRAP-type C4-dicarboxylate transport system permease small subunit
MSTLARGNDLPPPTGTVEVVQAALGRLYDTMIAIACVLLGLMVLSITTDVLLRNVALPGFPRGFAASNDFSEYSLYLCTLLAAPGLLRAGQHIRVDILLQAMPPRLAWTWMGVVMTAESYSSGAMQTKSLVVPEWCLLAPLPVAFALLGIEFGLRMWRLAHGPRGPRADAVSAA